MTDTTSISKSEPTGSGHLLKGERDPSVIAVAILDRIRWEQRGRSEQARIYPFAFKVGESVLRRLIARVTQLLDRLPTYEQTPILFSGEVRHPDLSSLRFDDVDELLDKAGDKKDPERLRLTWRKTLREPAGTFVQIEAIFKTEKRLETEELELLQFPVASMHLQVVGPDTNTVESIFSELSPFFESSRIRGIYRPLLVFRNHNFVHIASLGLGLLVWLVYNNIASRLGGGEVAEQRKSLVEKVEALPAIEEKFDAFINSVYGPSPPDPIFEGVLVFAFGIILWASAMIIGFAFLPKFVPRSGINIGLASGRYEEYENLFRLVVFTLLMSGIILPVLRSFFF